MKSRTVESYMTPSPHTIGANQTLAVAHRLMRDNGVRHLPVLDNGRLVGIVTQRDLHLIETLEDVDPETVRVEEAMTADPYVVHRDESLSAVVRHMTAHKIGSAIVVERDVVDGEHVIGVFTTVDALALLLDLLQRRRRRPPEPAPASW